MTDQVKTNPESAAPDSPFRGLVAEDRLRELHHMTAGQLRQVLAMPNVQKVVHEKAGFLLHKLLERYRVEHYQGTNSDFWRVKEAPNWVTVAKLPTHEACLDYLADHGCDAEGNLLKDPGPEVPPSLPSVKPSAAPVLTTGTWDGARQWLDSAQRCEQIKLYCQVMLGFELIALHKQLNISQGARTDFRHNGGSWEDILQKELNLKETTARRFRDMAAAAAPRLKKMAALKDFDPTTTAIALLPEPKQEALSKAVAKLTDGLTQKEFGEQFCGWKKPSGNPNAKGAGQTKETLSTEDEAAILRRMALEDSGRMGKAVAVSNKNFFVLTAVNDLEVQAQISLLEHALKLRRLWIDTPKSKRDPSILEPLLKDSPIKSA